MRALYALLGMEVMSVVGAKLISNERKTMSHKYNPTVTELRQAYEVAFGENGVYNLVGAMFANLDQDTIERLYAQVLHEVRQDLLEKGLI
jgi:DNA-binding protein Fis